jgi:hypothetical protein
VIVSWWRSLGGHSNLQRVTVSAWHNVGDDSAGVDDLFRTPLPSGQGWRCVVLAAFVCVWGVFVWWCSLPRVM